MGEVKLQKKPPRTGCRLFFLQGFGFIPVGFGDTNDPAIGTVYLHGDDPSPRDPTDPVVCIPDLDGFPGLMEKLRFHGN